MKLKTLRIGHFGKLHNVELNIGSGINVIYGANESGKSTLHAFIGAMLFGLDKGRGKAGKDDPYTKYKPWETPGAYQGSLDFEHEGKEYRLTRVFYQKEKSCLLTEINTGKAIPLEDDSITSFIPGLTKSAFYNTVSMGQNAAECSREFGDEVRNYIANLATTGGSRVNVPGALEELGQIRKNLLREQKAIDSTNLTLRRKELLELEREACEAETQKAEYLNQRAVLSDKYDKLEGSEKDINQIREEWKNARLKSEEAFARLKELQSAEAELKEKKGFGIGKAAIAFLAVGALLCLLGNDKSKVAVGIGVLLLLTGLVVLMFTIIGMKDKTKQKELLELTEQADREYSEAERSFNEITEQYDRESRQMNDLISEEKCLKAEINELDIAIERIEWKLENMGDIGDELYKCEEELERNTVREEELNEELSAVELALQTIGTISAGLHERFSQNFNDILSEEICLTTDGVYSGGRVNDDFETEVMSGIDYVPAGSLSVGATAQLYTALRFACARLLLEGIDVPILLDESFAFSDEQRMTSALSALSDRDNQQILIFTCTDRERRILDKLGTDYKCIEI